jgi:hypothetical protein
MARVWMAKGADMPRRASAVTSRSGRPSAAKVVSTSGAAAAASAAASSAISRSDRTGVDTGREDEPRRGERPRPADEEEPREEELRP